MQEWTIQYVYEKHNKRIDDLIAFTSISRKYYVDSIALLFRLFIFACMFVHYLKI